MDMEPWEEQTFNEITSQLDIEDPTVGVAITEINGAIWRMNQASTYLSRFLQFHLQHAEVELPDSVANLLHSLGTMARQVAVALEAHEQDLECLECLEEDSFEHAFSDEELEDDEDGA